MDNLRVSELAKELNITSKELIEKFAEISISVKSHSNVVTPEQVRKIKEHLGVAPKKSSAKKAFIVKKAKPVEELEVVKSAKKESVLIEKVERVQRVEKPALRPPLHAVGVGASAALARYLLGGLLAHTLLLADIPCEHPAHQHPCRHICPRPRLCGQRPGELHRRVHGGGILLAYCQCARGCGGGAGNAAHGLAGRPGAG